VIPDVSPYSNWKQLRLRFVETSVYINQTTQRHVPEDCKLRKIQSVQVFREVTAASGNPNLATQSYVREE
jgi:hypothetical protein